MTHVDVQPADLLLGQVRDYGFPDPMPEYRFSPPAMYRFDFAWVEHKLAVEIEGGVFSGGRHVRGIGYTKDCHKYNLAAIEGWTVLRFTSGMVQDNTALITLLLYFDKRLGITIEDKLCLKTLYIDPMKPRKPRVKRAPTTRKRVIIDPMKPRSR